MIKFIRVFINDFKTLPTKHKLYWLGMFLLCSFSYVLTYVVNIPMEDALFMYILLTLVFSFVFIWVARCIYQVRSCSNYRLEHNYLIKSVILLCIFQREYVLKELNLDKDKFLEEWYSSQKNGYKDNKVAFSTIISIMIKYACLDKKYISEKVYYDLTERGNNIINRLVADYPMVFSRLVYSYEDDGKITRYVSILSSKDNRQYKDVISYIKNNLNPDLYEDNLVEIVQLIKNKMISLYEDDKEDILFHRLFYTRKHFRS